ncbi:M48 family metallopeptidase [Aliarcobacter cryaerophilus]|uniref:M48 family metallopeptidase n=1 Tax=Aliarcobacter cryaerophilus TaxID=28198 RepID=A0A7G9LR25_9BACT|nr:M48 family metallopeptidase [Aliarcobacter cryaerophilus]QNM91074.1 M48 family metallopeptidase [Aliarcobacter cryaerophilus]
MRYFKIVIFATFVAILFSACTHKTPYTNRSQLILMSSQEELALGEKSYKESLSELKVITGTKDALRVQTIGQKIAVAANQPNYKWEFNLVEDNQANAFCLPGGKVVVYTGILKYAKNDDQLATVISHEVAHALARHGAERVTQGMIQQGVGLIGSVAVAATAPQYQNAFNQAYGLGSNLGVMLPYGRMQESEADEIGIYLMHKAGYNVNEATKFWENMSEGKSGGNDFFSTHPSSQNRTKDIQTVINKIGSEAK